MYQTTATGAETAVLVASSGMFVCTVTATAGRNQRRKGKLVSAYGGASYVSKRLRGRFGNLEKFRRPGAAGFGGFRPVSTPAPIVVTPV